MPYRYPPEFRRRVLDLLAGGMSPIGSRIRRWLNQSTYSRVAYFDVVEVPPGSFVADQFGLVQPDYRLGQGIVVGVAY